MSSSLLLSYFLWHLLSSSLHCSCLSHSCFLVFFKSSTSFVFLSSSSCLPLPCFLFSFVISLPLLLAFTLSSSLLSGWHHLFVFLLSPVSSWLSTSYLPLLCFFLALFIFSSSSLFLSGLQHFAFLFSFSCVTVLIFFITFYLSSSLQLPSLLPVPPILFLLSSFLLSGFLCQLSSSWSKMSLLPPRRNTI